MIRETCLRVFKDIVRLNMEIVDGVTGLLPENIKSSLSTLHRDVVTAVREVTDEYLKQNKPASGEAEKVKQVEID